MIAFACSHCVQKFQVKDEFAGRTTKCPTCKQPLVVPSADMTLAYVPKSQIDGTSSSLHQAGVDGGITLEQTDAGASPDRKPVRELLARRTKKGERYILEREIARGGMGAVLRAVDCDIRREVAVKYMLCETSSSKKLRFIEEAQITGQLEHPNIVPIHEMGVDAQQRFFISMKMVKGQSLAQVLTALRKDPKTGERDYPQSRLLTVFGSVCNALAYAHSRNVVHRDLKPANIMLGDFGEVYVMDWGLAKVLGGKEQVAGEGAAPPPLALPLGPGVAAPRSSSVMTSREETDLTQDGAVLGTPVYMPPEQACGRIQAIDRRSDVYSLGAILYEILTLEPPVDKEGGHLSVLMRVLQGQIVAPELRSPQRFRAGKIPKELSAIAMKALAKEPLDRYQIVEAFQRDIERFQEGRSVSAKEDTFREAVWKLVKRNRGASVTACIAAVVLAGILWLSFRAITHAKVEAEDALAALENEQGTKRERGKKSAPFFFRDARVSAGKQQIDYALAQVNVALEYDPELVEARLLKGQLLIVSQDFAAAGKELERYVSKRPTDGDAAELVKLCRKARPEDGSSSAPFVEVLERQKVFSLAELMERDRNKLLQLYRKRIEKAWPGRGDRLVFDKDGKCRVTLWGCPEVGDLAPLQGLPLIELVISDCNKVRDLAPLQGMPLTSLSLGGCHLVRDLTPLQGMPLTELDLSRCYQVRDLTPLHGMKLTTLSLVACNQLSDLAPLRGMPLTTLYLSGSGRVHDLAALKGMPLTLLTLTDCSPANLAPLEGMKLKEIHLTPKYVAKGMDVLRRMKSLKTIGVGVGANYPAEEFWRRYNNGEFKK